MHHGGCSTCAGVDPAVTPTLCPLRGNHRVPTGGISPIPKGAAIDIGCTSHTESEWTSQCEFFRSLVPMFQRVGSILLLPFSSKKTWPCTGLFIKSPIFYWKVFFNDSDWWRMILIVPLMFCIYLLYAEQCFSLVQFVWLSPNSSFVWWTFFGYTNPSILWKNPLKLLNFPRGLDGFIKTCT